MKRNPVKGDKVHSIRELLFTFRVDVLSPFQSMDLGCNAQMLLARRH